jgi:hypothetical protein
VKEVSLLRPETPAESLFFVTAHLMCDAPGGSWNGTGFFVRVPVRKGPDQLLLVSNRHVFAHKELGDAETIRIITPARSESEPPVLVAGERAVAIAHSPKFEPHANPNIDVAVMALNEIMMTDLNNPFIKTIPMGMLANDELINERDAIEQVTFIGYPDGRYDAVNMTPIARRGWTATPMSLDYNGEPTFLIDASVFEGSSGSPVFLLNVGGYTNRYGGLIFDGPPIVFLGIVARAYEMNTTGELIVARSGRQVSMDQALDLGIVYKTRIILETIDQFLAKNGYTRVPPDASAEDAEPQDSPPSSSPY